MSSRRPLLVGLVVVLFPCGARAEPNPIELARAQMLGSTGALDAPRPSGPVTTLVAGAVVLALSAVSSFAGALRQPPPVPRAAPPPTSSPRGPTWVVADPCRKPPLVATLVDLRF